MTTWLTLAPGIRCRDHATRKHGVRPDRYFTLRFTTADGQRVEEALGWASQGWSLHRAQEELGRLREARRTGKGPATLRQRAASQRRAAQQKAADEAARERREKTVSQLWDRYAADVVAVFNKPRTAEEKMRMYRRRIEPAIGALKIKDVSEEDAGAVVRLPLRLDATGRVIGGKAEAGNLYRLMHHMFAKALAWGLRPREFGNPLESIDQPRVPRRERLLTAGEIGALQRVLADSAEPPQVVAVIRAAILTGSRIGELLTLEWAHVRRDEMELHLPDTKSGFSRRPMSPETLAVLDSIERMPGSPFVFRAITDPQRPLAYGTVEKAFRRIAQRAGIKNCSLHTIRHWVGTMVANTVANPRIGMAITGHKSHTAYMTYVHGDRAQARALADQLAALATGLAEAEPNIAELRRGKR